MLSATVSLHDVVNIEGFVRGRLDDSSIRFEAGERDELVLEGIAIMYDLAGSYQHHLPGYEKPGRFSGYAARYLSRRLGEAWHRLHPEHIYTSREDGSREYSYLKPAISLDGIRARAVARGEPDTVDGRILERRYWTGTRSGARAPVRKKGVDGAEGGPGGADEPDAEGGRAAG
jgi:hypothetical protein